MSETQVHRIRLDYTPSPICSIAINPAKNTLLVGRDSGYAEIWNVSEYAFCMGQIRVTTAEDLQNVLWCTFNGTPAFAITTKTGELSVYSYPQLRLVAPPVKSHGGVIWDAAVNKEGNRIAMACEDGTCKVYSTEGRELEWCFQTEYLPNQALAVCFDNEGNLLMGGAKGKIACASGENGSFIRTFEMRDGSADRDLNVWSITKVAGGCFATGDSSGCVTIWDPVTATQVETFRCNKSDQPLRILSLATHENFLYASGEDPTISQFVYTPRNGRWAIQTHNRHHTNDVTGLVIGSNGRLISASQDAIIRNGHKEIYPFQNNPPVASAMRGDDVIVVSAASTRLTIWRLTGDRAVKEAILKTEEIPIDAVAISNDGTKIAYSSSGTKLIEWIDDQWHVNREVTYSASSALCFSEQGVLYGGTLEGEVYSSAKADTLNVGFPVFKFAISTKHNGQDICVGGLGKMVLIGPELDQIKREIPTLETPFSTFEFQPLSNRLFISTGQEKVQVYNVFKQKWITKMAIRFGKFGRVAVNSIMFDPDNRDRIALVSSKRAVMMHMNHRDAGFFRFKYTDILYMSLVAPNKIVIFEKPWVFFANTLPDAARTKRFHGKDEANLPRY